MAGSMAGTAILECPPQANALYAVGLTINNFCNLSCPHCYLQYESPQAYIAPSTLESIFAEKFDLCCVVGKEPLANRRSIEILDRLSLANATAGRKTSIITNGHNLGRLPRSVIQRLTWIDVSLDAGIDTYQAVRAKQPDAILAGARYANEVRPGIVRALYAIHDRNIDLIDGMFQFADAINASALMFSPYQETESNGTQSVSMVSPEAYLSALQGLIGSGRQRVYVTIDLKYLEKAIGLKDGRRLLEFLETKYHGCRNLIITARDPISRGMLRVTHDGLALRPFDSIDTRHYTTKGISIQNRNLSSVFDELRQTSECLH